MRARIAQRSTIEERVLARLGMHLSGIFPFFHLLPAPIQPEPFRWNVTFVESSRQSTTIEPTNDASSAREIHQAVEAGEQSSVPARTDVSSPGQQPKNEINETAKNPILGR